MSVPERIEVEVAEEMRRIDAWNISHPFLKGFSIPLLLPAEVRSLASHLVRNRLQVEMAQHHALLEAAKSVEWAVVEFNSDGTVAYRACPSCGGPDRPDYIGPEGHFPECQLAAAIAAVELKVVPHAS